MLSEHERLCRVERLTLGERGMHYCGIPADPASFHRVSVAIDRLINGKDRLDFTDLPVYSRDQGLVRPGSPAPQLSPALLVGIDQLRPLTFQTLDSSADPFKTGGNIARRLVVVLVLALGLLESPQRRQLLHPTHQRLAVFNGDNAFAPQAEPLLLAKHRVPYIDSDSGPR
mmetsp:Transcript_23696/g.74171  ORF Transcript_23696/g.74171 Transcript_23696/m.74171 type:complete len:171 (+) Transcript_23696:1635-2147(+)